MHVHRYETTLRLCTFPRIHAHLKIGKTGSLPIKRCCFVNAISSNTHIFRSNMKFPRLRETRLPDIDSNWPLHQLQLIHLHIQLMIIPTSYLVRFWEPSKVCAIC